MNLLLALMLILDMATTCLASTMSPVFAIKMDWHGGLKAGLDSFSLDLGRYPSTAEGLAALVQCPTNLAGRWHGAYLETVPRDPWGNEYVYRCPGLHNTNGYDIYSSGEDGHSGSDGNDPDDINNWDPLPPHGGFDYVNQDNLHSGFFSRALVVSLAVIL